MSSLRCNAQLHMWVAPTFFSFHSFHQCSVVTTGALNCDNFVNENQSKSRNKQTNKQTQPLLYRWVCPRPETYRRPQTYQRSNTLWDEEEITPGQSQSLGPHQAECCPQALSHCQSQPQMIWLETQIAKVDINYWWWIIWYCWPSLTKKSPDYFRHTSAWPAGASFAPKTERGRNTLIPGASYGTCHSCVSF